MTIYRLSDYSDGARINVRYFDNRDRALREAVKLARVYEAMNEITLMRNDVNKFGILCVWTDKWPDPTTEIRLTQGEVESGA